jgi:hypothetical protein
MLIGVSILREDTPRINKSAGSFDPLPRISEIEIALAPNKDFEENFRVE